MVWWLQEKADSCTGGSRLNKSKNNFILAHLKFSMQFFPGKIQEVWFPDDFIRINHDFDFDVSMFGLYNRDPPAPILQPPSDLSSWNTCHAETRVIWNTCHAETRVSYGGDHDFAVGALVAARLYLGALLALRTVVQAASHSRVRCRVARHLVVLPHHVVLRRKPNGIE